MTTDARYPNGANIGVPTDMVAAKQDYIEDMLAHMTGEGWNDTFADARMQVSAYNADYDDEEAYAAYVITDDTWALAAYNEMVAQGHDPVKFDPDDSLALLAYVA